MNQQSFTHIRLRRDTSQNWNTNNPILKVGEPGLETDTRKLKFGDGITLWTNLPYSSIDINDNLLLENIDDRVANLIKAGSNVTVAYNDNYNELTIGTSGLQPSGNYATLVNGRVSSSELPSYVDDVLEFANLSIFPLIGEVDKIYVAIDTNKIYRWSGSTYIEISASPGSTDAIIEGSVNKYYTDIRASGAAPVQSVSGRTGNIILSKADITNFDISVSGLLPGVTGTGYVISSFTNNIYSIGVTGVQPSGNYSVVGHSHIISDVSGLQVALDSKQPSGVYASGVHTHVSSDLTDFSSSVSGLLPSVSGSGYAVTSFNNNVYTVSVSGVQPSGNYSTAGHTHDDRYYTESEIDALQLTAQTSFTNIQSTLNTKAPISNPIFTGNVSISSGTGNFNTLTVNTTGVSISGHTHSSTNITDFNTSVDSRITMANLQPSGNYSVVGHTHNNSWTSLGVINGGTYSINYDASSLAIQSLTLNGNAVTFNKGSGWPSASNVSVDTVLRITATSATSITWSIVTDWFNQAPAGPLNSGTHLFLLRSLGSSIIEGHYISSKTN